MEPVDEGAAAAGIRFKSTGGKEEKEEVMGVRGQGSSGNDRLETVLSVGRFGFPRCFWSRVRRSGGRMVERAQPKKDIGDTGAELRSPAKIKYEK